MFISHGELWVSHGAAIANPASTSKNTAPSNAEGWRIKRLSSAISPALQPLADAYLHAWSHAERAPRIGVVRAIFPADSRASAQAELAVDIERHIPRLQREGLINEALDLQEHLRLMNVHHGHPDEVIESLQHDPSLLPYADYVIAVVQAESSTQAQILKRLEIIAKDIAPALGWQKR